MEFFLFENLVSKTLYLQPDDMIKLQNLNHNCQIIFEIVELYESVFQTPALFLSRVYSDKFFEIFPTKYEKMLRK